ncbi:MAG: glycerol-3-phosphate acyltransferase [Gemmatimonadetes bacterium]|nr:glycerol-3-phosphate acyltransferase [Gemmatimonadota bacterium]
MFDLPLGARLASITAFGYAVGCLNAGYYLVRLSRGADLRTLHTGNAGATNAGRVLGRRGFATVFLLDAGKGVLAALVGSWLAGYGGAVTGAMSAIAGHVWPAQLAFRGGLGIATAIGGFLVVEPFGTAAVIGLVLLLHALTRRWSASGLVGIMAAPLVLFALGRPPRALLGVLAAAALLLLIRVGDVRDALRPPTA